MTISPEQISRNLLQDLGVSGAQSYTSGDLVVLSHIVAAYQFAQRVLSDPDFVHTEQTRRLLGMLNAVTPANIAELCPKCSSPLAPGKALESTMAPASHPDHLTDSTGRGATLRPSGAARMVPVLKCPQCGYSRAQGARSPA